MPLNLCIVHEPPERQEQEEADGSNSRQHALMGARSPHNKTAVCCIN